MRIFTNISVAILALGVASSAFAGKDPRFSATPFLPAVQQKVDDYYSSGQYNSDVALIVTKAINYLNKRLEQKPNKKLAIVLDIDDTVLSSQPNEKTLSYGFYMPAWNKWVKNESFPAIKPMLTLDRYAKTHHIALFFITGRHENQRKYTKGNLDKAGFTYWQHLYMKPMSYKLRSAIPYKTSERKMLTKKGYDIVLSMGDQYSDLEGGYVEKTFKLPNKMYYIP